MNPLQSLIALLVLLGVLITVHELGHFLMAKLCGIQVLKFSIGFGPRIVGFSRGDTEYRIGWIPLGGYVKMAGEQPHDEVAPQDVQRSFLHQPPWKRAVVILGGPVFNLLFPIIAFFFVYLGTVELDSTRIGYVVPENPAAVAGIKTGDRIRRIGGNEVRTFNEIREALIGVFERPVPVEVERDGQMLNLTVTPLKTEIDDGVEKIERGVVGILSMPRPAVVGVPEGSVAMEQGLRTFDRIARIDGKTVRDEIELNDVVSKIPVGNAMEVEVLRSHLIEGPGAKFVTPEVAKLTVTRTAGDGFAAIGGAEIGELYVWSVTPGSPAERVGIQRGDRLLSAEGKPLQSIHSLELVLRRVKGEKFPLTWRTGREDRSVDIAQEQVSSIDELKNENHRLDLGVRPRTAFLDPESDPLAAGARAEKVTLNIGPKEALVSSLKIVPAAIRKVALVIGGLFTRKVPTESIGSLGTLYLVAQKSAEAGFTRFMEAMAMLSINLGLMNLLPIPVLDGFALLSTAWEGIRRRPIPIRAREYANMVGLMMLAMLMVLALKNDITRFLR